MTTDRDREAFEVWARDLGMSTGTDDQGRYANPTLNHGLAAYRRGRSDEAHAPEAGAQEPVAVPAKELYPAHPGALRACMAELDMWLDSSDALDEIKNQQSFGESIMLVVHELKRLQSVLAAAPVSPPADHSEDTLDMVKAPPAESGEVERLRSHHEEIEYLAQWLHDEGGFGDAWACHTWPEHPDDDGRREGSYVKLVPSDVQAKFRDVARRLLRGRTLSHTPAPQPGGAVKVKALAERAGTLLRGLEQWPEDRHPSFSKGDWGEIKAVIAEAAAIEPSPLGWNAGAFEAGAKAMLLEALSAARSAIVTSGLDRHACIIADDAITQAIRALPLPTPPAGEG